MHVWRRTIGIRGFAVAVVLLAAVALAAYAAAAVPPVQVAQEAGEASKLNVVILATGGTIAGSAETETQAGYESGQVGVDSPKPVVMTAAMRPSTALSADGPLNLYNAVAVAADRNAIGRGVVVVANDDIHGARDVTKTNTTGVATFKLPLSGLIGETLYGVNNYFRSPYKRHTVNSGLRVEGLAALPRVDIIYANADMSADLIDAAVELGAQGLVVAGVGNGNMTGAALETLGRARQNGVVCVRSTRVPTGAVGRNVEIDDDARGLVASGSLNPAKSRVLLKLALLHTTDPGEVQDLFDIY